MKDLYLQVVDTVFDVFDIFKYDLLRIPLPKVNLPKSVPMQFMFDEKNKHYIAISPKYKGLITYGNNTQELWENLNDAIMTYFDTPRATALRIGNPYDLPLPNGERIIQRKSVALALNG